MTQEQYEMELRDHPGEAPVLSTRPWSGRSIYGFDAEDLGVVIAEAVGSANDVDGICWKLVGQLVIEALTSR